MDLYRIASRVFFADVSLDDLKKQARILKRKGINLLLTKDLIKFLGTSDKREEVAVILDALEEKNQLKK